MIYYCRSTTAICTETLHHYIGWGNAQVAENLKSLEVLPKLTPDVLEKIDAIMQSAPDAPASFR